MPGVEALQDSLGKDEESSPTDDNNGMTACLKKKNGLSCQYLNVGISTQKSHDLHFSTVPISWPHTVPPKSPQIKALLNLPLLRDLLACSEGMDICIYKLKVSEFAHTPLPCVKIKDHTTADHGPPETRERPGVVQFSSCHGTLMAPLVAEDHMWRITATQPHSSNYQRGRCSSGPAVSL